MLIATLVALAVDARNRQHTVEFENYGDKLVNSMMGAWTRERQA